MVAAEIVSGLSGLKAAFDLAKALKDIDDKARRNAAVIELQETILNAQQAQAALIETISHLEKEVARFETWETEKKRYALKDYGSGTFAYELKESEAHGEPLHRVCPACYQSGKISILQNNGGTFSGRQMYYCFPCKQQYFLGEYRPRSL
jgi:hypothetical protein